MTPETQDNKEIIDRLQGQLDGNTEILCDIPNGSALSISGFSKGWGYTQYNGMDGWVHLSDLYIEYVS